VNILLLSANTERINLPTLPLGLAWVGAAVRAAGHEVVLLDLLRETDPAAATRRAIEALRPDGIGISVRNIDDQCMESPRFLLDRPPAYAVELCRGIAAQRLDIPWRCILYPHDVPEALVRALADAGCVEVGLGFEWRDSRSGRG
jgi:hypothetical protein